MGLIDSPVDQFDASIKVQMIMEQCIAYGAQSECFIRVQLLNAFSETQKLPVVGRNVGRPDCFVATTT